MATRHGPPRAVGGATPATMVLLHRHGARSSNSSRRTAPATLLRNTAVPDGGERVARGCRQARKGVAVCNKAQAAAPTAAAQWQLRARGSAAPYVRGGGGTDEGPRWRQSGRTWSGRGTLRLYAAQLVPGSEDQARSCMCAKAAGQTQSARMQKSGATDPARNETRRGHGRDAACDLRGMLRVRVPAPHGALA